MFLFWGGPKIKPLCFAVYSNALQESANSILYNGLIEELVDVLQITDKQLMVSPQPFLFPKSPPLQPPHVPPSPKKQNLGHQSGLAADADLHRAPGEDPETQQHHRLHRHRLLPRLPPRPRPQLHPSHDRWVRRELPGGFLGGFEPSLTPPRAPPRPLHGALSPPVRHRPLLLPLPPGQLRRRRRGAGVLRHDGGAAEGGQDPGGAISGAPPFSFSSPTDLFFTFLPKTKR